MTVAVGTEAADAAPLRVALGEFDMRWEDPRHALRRAESIIHRASQAGARLVVLPEMCLTGFSMDAARWSEPLERGPGTMLGHFAAQHGTWVLAGLAAGDTTCRATFNVAALYDPSGTLVGAYRKRKLFAFGGEDAAYAAGTAPVVFDVEGVRLAPIICYELRFPELFRPVARDTDAFVVIANWPAVRRAHWDALLRARAIENLSYVVGVNRTGAGGGIDYDGGSTVIDPWGETIATTGMPRDTPTVAALDPARVRDLRARYPFLDDLRD